MCDVIVVGAGPAGSTASKTLADKGHKVLLVEKFKMPRYKSCSGQLIKKSIGLVQEYYGEPVPASAMCVPTENRGMIFTNDKGKSFRFEQDCLNVWRSSFDKWLADKAASIWIITFSMLIYNRNYLNMTRGSMSRTISWCLAYLSKTVAKRDIISLALFPICKKSTI